MKIKLRPADRIFSIILITFLVPFVAPIAAIEINEGIDTYLASRHPDGISTDGEGCCGNNVPVGQPLSGHNTMEVDTNQGGTGPVEPLIWFDLDLEPQPGKGTILERFEATPGARATLRISVTNGFDPLTLRRITVDWISDPADGGNNISRNRFPGAPNDLSASAFVPGVNVESTSDTIPDPAFENQATGIITTDVTADVVAWASGIPNYGWAGLPGASQGGLIETFETDDPALRPTLILGAPNGRRLKPGDGSTYISFISPAPNSTRAAATQPITLEIINGPDPIDLQSLVLTVNAAEVEFESVQQGDILTVSWTPVEVFPPSALVPCSVSFSNTGSAAAVTSEEWSYQVNSYAVLEPSLAQSPVNVDINLPGFLIKTSEVGASQILENSLARAEAQLAGTLLDPVFGEILTDISLPGDRPDGRYTWDINFDAGRFSQVINFSVTGEDSGNFITSEGFTEDFIPGVFFTENLAMEVTGFLDLPAGYYRLGVNSDDGFRVVVAENPREFFAVQLGEFGEGRAAADSLFDVFVQEDGIYPIRLVWFQGAGAGSVEFFSVNLETGEKILINDPKNDRAIRAYFESASTTPFIESVSPSPNVRIGSLNSLKPSVNIKLVDGTNKVAEETIELTINGEKVDPVITRTDDTVTVSFAPTLAADPTITHTARLIFRDASGSFERSQEWQFRNLKQIILPDPVLLENFNSVSDGSLPAGWTELNFTDSVNNLEDPFDPDSETYLGWTGIQFSTLATVFPSRLGVAPEQLVNGQRLDELADGGLVYAESDNRAGNQVQFLFSPAYDLSNVSSAVVVFHSIYAQNQDSIGAMEYSIDGGQSWLPILYMLDNPDIVRNPDGTVDAVATMTAANGDTASWTDPDTGQVLGDNYGAFIAAPITQSIAPYIQGRVNDDQTESKRVEIFRLSAADGQSAVQFRFAQGGTGSWYFGIDNFGIYDTEVFGPVSDQPEEPSIRITLENNQISLDFSGTLLSADAVTGPYLRVVGASSPLPVTLEAPHIFWKTQAE